MELKKRLTPEVETLLNERLKAEYLSVTLFEGIANWCNCYGFMKAKDVFRQYADEELSHARRLADYMLDRCGNPKIGVLPEQPSDYKSLLDVVVKAYDHAILITEGYNKLAKQLLAVGDHVTYKMVQWYLKDQVHEEVIYADAITFANRLGLTDDSKGVEWKALEHFLGNNLNKPCKKCGK